MRNYTTFYREAYDASKHWVQMYAGKDSMRPKPHRGKNTVKWVMHPVFDLGTLLHLLGITLK